MRKGAGGGHRGEKGAREFGELSTVAAEKSKGNGGGEATERDKTSRSGKLPSGWRMLRCRLQKGPTGKGCEVVNPALERLRQRNLKFKVILVLFSEKQFHRLPV